MYRQLYMKLDKMPFEIKKTNILDLSKVQRTSHFRDLEQK